MSTPRSLALPTGVVRREIPAAGTTFAVLEGTPDGPLRGHAVLVPGFTGSKEDFLAILAPLAGEGYRVWAIDQRGQYETPGPERPDGYDLAEFGRDVSALAAALTDQRVHLVGHSFGGLVARSAATTSPSRWRSVTWMCSGAGALPSEQHDRMRQLAALVGVHGLAGVWDAVQQLEEQEGVLTVTHDTDVRQFLRERFVRNSPGSLLAMAEALLSTVDEDAVFDSDALATLPRHVVTGEHDDVWSVAEQRARAERLRAPFSLIMDAGHSPAVDQPEVTAATLAERWRAADAVR